MDGWDAVLAAAAGLAGAVNAVAGGGTLLTFPALDAALGGTAASTVAANATSTVALWPGSFAGFWGYRHDWKGAKHRATVLLLPSLVGGTLGSLLVIALPAETFRGLVGWLILLATVLFAAQPAIGRLTGMGLTDARPSASHQAVVVGFQFLVALYGGYFGAGIGILMLAALALLGMTDMNQMNAVKTLLATLINGCSVAIFAASGQVQWRYAAVMMAASVVGGYYGARGARRLPRLVVRRAVILIGLSLGLFYVVRP